MSLSHEKNGKYVHNKVCNLTYLYLFNILYNSFQQTVNIQT